MFRECDHSYSISDAVTVVAGQWMSILSIQTVWAVNQTIQVKSRMLSFSIFVVDNLPSYEHYFITSSLNLYELTITKLIKTQLTDIAGIKTLTWVDKPISRLLITFSCSWSCCTMTMFRQRTSAFSVSRRPSFGGSELTPPARRRFYSHSGPKGLHTRSKKCFKNNPCLVILLFILRRNVKH